MANWTDAEWDKIAGEVSQRAAIDPDFRALVLTNPNAGIKGVSGKEVPGNVTVRFVENTDTNKTVPLYPPIREIEDLSDMDLEQVAGGDISAGWRR